MWKNKRGRCAQDGLRVTYVSERQQLFITWIQMHSRPIMFPEIQQSHSMNACSCIPQNSNSKGLPSNSPYKDLHQEEVKHQ
ncbi:hypothetical protein VULLAG_LOCUS6398 [Vulpes lagopus]